MLSWWQWGVLGAVPPAILSLYFLKLKRLPLEVPSTYLWKRSIEDLHVNSIWQRLRKSLLLLLQLIIIALVMLALLSPSWQGSQLSGGRYIFLLDNSASMSATDVEPTRLDAAKARIASLIGQMNSGDKAMLISFSDTAQVQQTYTDDRRLLARRLAAVGPSEHRTSLREALSVSSGLANPGSSSFDETDLSVADPLPARLFLFSDGKFDDVKDFALENLYASEEARPIFVPLGRESVANVAIISLGIRRNEQHLEQLQAYVGLENFSTSGVHVQIQIDVDGALFDAKEVDLAAERNGGEVFGLAGLTEGEIHVRLSEIKTASGGLFKDALPLDDEAWAVLAEPRRCRLLIITPGNLFLERALSTDQVQKRADVTVATVELLSSLSFQKEAADGEYDLIIYDRCGPTVDADPNHPLKKMPQANTLFIGALPPLPERWPRAKKVSLPVVIDSDRQHPLMQWVEMDGVVFDEAIPLSLPEDSGVRSLIETTAGTIFAISPRGGYEDAVLSAEIIEQVDGEQHFKTNWWRKPSFPIFIGRVVAYLGRTPAAVAGRNVRPGEPIELRCRTSLKWITVTGPTGKRTKVRRGQFGTFGFSETGNSGIYQVSDDDQVIDRFAVNLFDSTESDIRLRAANQQGDTVIRIGHEEITAAAGWEPTRREGWRFLLILVLVVAVFEWYIYNRRVYL